MARDVVTYIEIAGVRGDVATIALLSTTLVHADRSRVIIPNRKVAGEIPQSFGPTWQLHLLGASDVRLVNGARAAAG